MDLPVDLPVTAPGRAGYDARFGLRCDRCGRTQPALPRGVFTCVYCSAVLPVQRWRAEPPPGALLTKPRPGRVRAYFGPPSYRGQHPRWGFPPVIWRPAEIVAGVGDDAVAVPPVGGLRIAMVSAGLTVVAALAAAAGEFWRFRLLLRGRTEVLGGGQVTASDALVRSAGWAAVGLGVLTALILLPTLVRGHGAAAAAAGLAPSRRSAGVLARLVIPGWNVYGAGQILGEIDGMLAVSASESTDPPGRPRLSWLVLGWWSSWVLNAVLVLLALIRAFGRSEQAMADTVELHLAVDLAGAAVALLTVLLVRRFRVRFAPPAIDALAGWRVAAPAPTSDRRRVPPVGVVTEVAESEVAELIVAEPDVAEPDAAPAAEPSPAA